MARNLRQVHDLTLTRVRESTVVADVVNVDMHAPPAFIMFMGSQESEIEPFSTPERSERVENFLFRATREYTEAGIEQAIVAMRRLGAVMPNLKPHRIWPPPVKLGNVVCLIWPPPVKLGNAVCLIWPPPVKLGKPRLPSQASPCQIRQLQSCLI